MKHKVRELQGALLDAAVAKAEGLPVHPGRDYVVAHSINTRWAHEFQFSTDWRDAGPIIEREGISLHKEVAPDRYNEWGDQPPFPISWEARCRMSKITGPTPLIAAMRAFVASKLGDTVEIEK